MIDQKCYDCKQSRYLREKMIESIDIPEIQAELRNLCSLCAEFNREAL